MKATLHRRRVKKGRKGTKAQNTQSVPQLSDFDEKVVKEVADLLVSVFGF